MANASSLDNPHITLDKLTNLLSTELSKLEGELGEALNLQYLGLQKKLDDATTRVLVCTKNNSPLAVIICSRPIAPNLVERGTKIAESIRDVVGEEQGKAIITPLAHGYIDNLSYVILPYYYDLSSWRPIRVCQRLWLQKDLLLWLRNSTTRAVEKINSNNHQSTSFSSLLEYLGQQHFMDKNLKRSITFALDRLDNGVWQPKHTIDHNDLWLGNVMLHSRNPIRSSPKYPFVLIDWNGANPNGYGIYDLLRIAGGLRLSAKALSREIDFHCTALRCEREDARGHLLASLAQLHKHLEHFPESRYLETLHTCWARLNEAILIKN